MEKIKVEVINSSSNDLPMYATEYSAGLDVRAFLPLPNPSENIKFLGKGFNVRINKDDTVTIILPPKARILIPTGLKVAVPEGYELQVRPRSGLAIKNGITVLNTPGTVDSDYRGDVGVILINNSLNDFAIENGDRIAQLVFTPVVHAVWSEVLELPETVRGEGGFGHTGKE